MLDRQFRVLLAPSLDRGAAVLGRVGLSPRLITGAGLAAGLGACGAIALRAWILGLVLWLVNRGLDGLDGPLARRSAPTLLGGLLDFTADFVVYSGVIVAVAIAHPGARLACVVLLATYLVNNVALLSFSSVAERLALARGDERTLRLTPGLAEGGETIVVYVLFCVLPAASATIAWVFAAMVAITAVGRVLEAVRTLEAATPEPTG